MRKYDYEQLADAVGKLWTYEGLDIPYTVEKEDALEGIYNFKHQQTLLSKSDFDYNTVALLLCEGLKKALNSISKGHKSFPQGISHITFLPRVVDFGMKEGHPPNLPFSVSFVGKDNKFLLWKEVRAQIRVRVFFREGRGQLTLWKK